MVGWGLPARAKSGGSDYTGSSVYLKNLVKVLRRAWGTAGVLGLRCLEILS